MSIIHNSPQFETTQTPINRKMHKCDTYAFYHRLLYQREKDKLPPYATTWINLKDNVGPKQSDTHKKATHSYMIQLI